MKKTILLAFFTTCLIGTRPSLFGQNMGAQAARVVANQHSQFQMQNQMRMMHSMAMNHSSTTVNNLWANYIVMMKDSTVKTVYGIIQFDAQNDSYLKTVDLSKKKKDPAHSLKIYPKDTHSITKVFPNKKQSVPGLPADSCWLFKSVEGKINGYSFLPLPQNSSATNSNYFKFFQKGEGKLQVLQKDSLTAMMLDNEKAKNYIKKDNPYKALVEYNKGKTSKK